jgi:holliday junction DNA helicase RuvA
MIAYVTGRLSARKPTEVIIEAGGIGYRVHVPTSTGMHLPAVGEAVHLHTHHHIREDAEQLFGFRTEAERDAFEIMLGVSGIGPRLGLAVLSALSPAELQEHVLQGNTAMLTGIPGVGKKTAERLVLELRDRLTRLEIGPGETGLPRGHAADARADALAALESLGLSRAAAEKNLRRVLRDQPDITSTEALVRLALRD